MAAQGRNEGIHVLDDFICEAIPSPSVSLSDSAKHGRNDGMLVVEELIHECVSILHRPASIDAALKTEAERLAVVISASADPVSLTARFQQMLLDEIANLKHSPKQ